MFSNDAFLDTNGCVNMSAHILSFIVKRRSLLNRLIDTPGTIGNFLVSFFFFFFSIGPPMQRAICR